MSEQVLVVSTEILEPYFNKEIGFISGSDAPELYEFLKTSAYFVERAPAESDISKRQLIPYVNIRFNDSIYVTERTNKQTEVRLHNKISIGLGGHINPIDFLPGDDIIKSGMLRELDEEVFLPEVSSVKFKGYIYDNTSSVGLVHIGLLYEVWLKSDDVYIKEVDKMKGWWCGVDELKQFSDRLETWSKIASNQIVYNEIHI
jgi:predicted NUDIX family phosphoesterase